MQPTHCPSQQGRSLFHNNCSGCHNFKQDGIGPDLAGVTESDSTEWLKKYIRAPKSLIESGDDRAKKLLARYHTLMPSFPGINDEQTDQLIAFLHTQKGKSKRKEDPLAIRDPFPEKIPASDIRVELEPFSQMPATSDKEPLTRISKMDWVHPAKTWFILDQRGKLYKLENGKPVTLAGHIPMETPFY